MKSQAGDDNSPMPSSGSASGHSKSPNVTLLMVSLSSSPKNGDVPVNLDHYMIH